MAREKKTAKSSQSPIMHQPTEVELNALVAELRGKNELLTKANDDLKNFLNRTDIAIIFLDEDLKIRSYTPTVSEIFDMRDIDIARPLEELKSRLAYDKGISDAREVLRTLQSKEVEVQRKDGVWYKMRVVPYLTAQNEVNGLVLSFLDINQQKTGIADLRQARDYLESLFDNASAPIVVWNSRFEITRFNHAFERLTGFKAAEVLGKHLDVLIPWEARDQALKKIYATFEKGQHWEAVEIPIQDLEGSVHIVLWNSAVLFDPDGKTPMATIAQGQDITERKKAEEEQVRLTKELAERLSELESVLDSSPFAIWICRDPECRMITGNLFASQLFGVEKGANVSVSAPIGQAAVSYRVMRDEVEMKPEELPAQVAIMIGKPVAPRELEFIFEDGRRVFMLVGAVPLLNPDGSARGAVAVGTDISQRRQIEAEMIHLASFPELNPLPIAELEADGRVKYMNPAMMRLFPGIKVLGAGHAFLKDWDKLVSFFKTTTERAVSREVKVGEAWYLQTASVTPSGAFRVYAQDITETKKSEQVKDDFIGMVSHELRTPLTVVSSAVKTALDDRVTQEDRMQLLQEANSAAESLGGILENLLELSRQQAGRLSLNKEMTNLNEVVQNTSLRLLQQYPARRVALDIAPDLPAVMVDSGRLQLVLHNLLENAFKYSEEGSEVRVFARRDSKEIIIGVSDHGEGIPSEDQRKLFEPFGRLDSAKKTKGIGLGLVVCKRLVEVHGGRIWVESARGVGSTFFFSIPQGQENRAYRSVSQPRK
jgi:PAS domain S-box-containing protein